MPDQNPTDGRESESPESPESPENPASPESSESPENWSPGEFDEEAWEAEVTLLLQGLPAVEPPPGFLATAVDHRPLFATRLTVCLVGTSVAVLIGVAAFGGFSQPEVLPSVDSLAARHSFVAVASEGGATKGGATGGDATAGEVVAASDDANFEPVDPPAAPPVSLPADYEQVQAFEADQLRQALFAHQGKAVSVFSEPGQIEWDRMPNGEVEEVDGVKVWLDRDRQVAVVQSEDSAVTIVGLSAAEVRQALRGLPGDGGGWRQLREAVSALTVELGFPG